MRSTSPPGSTTAPRLLASSKTIEQFCWNGVTGTIAALRPGMAGFLRLRVGPLDIGWRPARGNRPLLGVAARRLLWDRGHARRRGSP